MNLTQTWRNNQTLALATFVFACVCGSMTRAEPPRDSAAVINMRGDATGTNEVSLGVPRNLLNLVLRLAPVDVNVKQVVVTAMAVDPRGELLAVAGDDHVIRILDVQTMNVVHVLGEGAQRKAAGPGHFDWIRTLAFDAEGGRLASAGNDGQLILWDRRRDFAVMQEIKSAPALACVRFSPSGNQIAAVGFDRQVFLIGKTNGSMPRLTCDCADLRCCAYRGDEAMLAVAGRDGHLHLFDPIAGKSLSDLQLHSARIRDMAFQPGSSILVSVSEDGEMVRLNTQSLEVLSRERITSGRLFTLACINATRIAAAGSDDAIHLIRVKDDGKTIVRDGTLSGHVGSISTLVMSNGSLISGGFDATLRRWDLRSPGAAENTVARVGDATVKIASGIETMEDNRTERTSR